MNDRPRRENDHVKIATEETRRERLGDPSVISWAHAHTDTLAGARRSSPDDTRVAALLHRVGKFYVFLRTVRAELFDEAFQAELAAAA